MAFIHPLLLAGLVSVGLPILLHLLMRQKPKHLLFPAFRFLQKRAKTNQRKIRLRHLILLLLRMLLIALIVLALARPRMFSDRTVGFMPNQSVAAVIVIDTSRSMEYTVAGKTRLDDAKQRALEMLDDVAESSRVAVIDTADAGREWLTVAQARDRIRGLNLRAGSQPVTSAVSAAYALFDELDREQSGPENEAMPRFLYVFSDRTVACWDSSRLGDLQAQRDRLPAPGVTQLFIDVGVEKPIDVAITSIELKPQSVPVNRPVVLKVTVAATGQACDGEVLCRLVGESVAERKPVKLEAGQSVVIEFTRKNLKPGQQYQAEITLIPTDALPGDNVRFVTFEVRGPRSTLVITDVNDDDGDYARLWRAALESFGEFDCEVKTPAEIGSPDDLKPYLAVVLLSVRAPSQGGENSLWPKLDKYVKAGGSLLVAPGRDLSKQDYTSGEAMGLLPGRIEKIIDIPGEKGAVWDTRAFNKHPLLVKFSEWDRQGVGFMRRLRSANHYWAVAPLEKQNVIVPYAGKDQHPAILERNSSWDKRYGHVLMFTTTLEYRPGAEEWNDYASTVDGGFIVALANETMKYMVGDLEEANFNYTSGQTLALPVPQSARFPEYTLEGPGVVGGDSRLLREESATDLRIRQTDAAGNFVVSGGGNPAAWQTRYSLNPPPNEFLLERVPTEEIEKLFGPESVVPVEQNRKMTDIVTNRTRQPIELFAWLMLLFVLFLGVESWFANRFYKEEPQATAAT